MVKLLEILGMQNNEYEGCSTEQIANVCNIYIYI